MLLFDVIGCYNGSVEFVFESFEAGLVGVIRF